MTYLINGLQTTLTGIPTILTDTTVIGQILLSTPYTSTLSNCDASIYQLTSGNYHVGPDLYTPTQLQYTTTWAKPVVTIDWTYNNYDTTVGNKYSVEWHVNGQSPKVIIVSQTPVTPVPKPWPIVYQPSTPIRTVDTSSQVYGMIQFNLPKGSSDNSAVGIHRVDSSTLIPYGPDLYDPSKLQYTIARYDQTRLLLDATAQIDWNYCPIGAVTGEYYRIDFTYATVTPSVIINIKDKII